jgi:Uma2 family endonuclease
METVVESPALQTAVSEPAPSGTRRLVSYAEYRELDVDDDYQYELLHGDLVKKSAPSPQHQIIVVRLTVALHRFCEQQQLGGEILVAPVDVVVDEFNAPQPDVLYVSEARREIITADGIVGAPDVVMEVISPSSISRDRHLKRKLYERLGVQEYWIIDPNNAAIEVYRLTPEGYDLTSFAAYEGLVQSGVLQGFSVQVQDIMKHSERGRTA